MPVCGSRGFLGGYISDVLSRAFGGVRVLLVSSKDPSLSKRVYSRCTSRCSRIGTFRVSGDKIDTTQGFKVSGSDKRCLYFVSSSSCIRSRCLRYFNLGMCLSLSLCVRKCHVLNLGERRRGGFPRGTICCGRGRPCVCSRVGFVVTSPYFGLCEEDIIRRGRVLFSRSVSLNRSRLFSLGCCYCMADMCISAKYFCGCICRNNRRRLAGECIPLRGVLCCSSRVRFFEGGVFTGLKVVGASFLVP